MGTGVVGMSPGSLTPMPGLGKGHGRDSLSP
jgi:uncharacterized membrane protein AbrB (regulator of aidB expression)